MTTDIELLKAAAKAAGIDTERCLQYSDGAFDWPGKAGRWNPLTDDGDAFRLAVRLDFAVIVNRVDEKTTVEAGYSPAMDGRRWFHEHYGGTDPLAATRRAIVRAAAALGSNMSDFETRWEEAKNETYSSEDDLAFSCWDQGFYEAKKQAADEITRLRAELESVQADAQRYRYLRNRLPAEVFGTHGVEAGCWIDCEDENGVLTLVTGDDADAAIDASMGAKAMAELQAEAQKRGEY